MKKNLHAFPSHLHPVIRFLAALIFLVTLTPSALTADTLKRMTVEIGGREYTLIRVEPGTFMMGIHSAINESVFWRDYGYSYNPARFSNELPSHSVTITRPFYILEHEVTQGMYQSVTGNDPVADFFKASDIPVFGISWEDAVGYCARLSSRLHKRVRLPTEAEWEYCCRAGSPTRFYWGDDTVRARLFADYGKDAYIKALPDSKFDKPTSVKSLEPNRWELYDMLGNVSEWCSDWYSVHTGRGENGPEIDPQGPATGTTKVLRGGDVAHSLIDSKCASRMNQVPDKPFFGSYAGFRFVIEEDQPVPQTTPKNNGTKKPIRRK